MFNLNFLENEGSNEKVSFHLFDLILRVESFPDEFYPSYQPPDTRARTDPFFDVAF